MGRAHAPQRRSHHHRPAISVKEPSISDSESRNCSFVLFRIGIGKHAGSELVEFPNFQIREIPEHGDVANYFRALTKQRVNQQTPLAIENRLLSVIIRSIKELATGWIHRRQ